MRKAVVKNILGVLCFLFVGMGTALGQTQSDTTANYTYNGQNGGLFLSDPANYNIEVVFDPITGNYLVYRKIGDLLIKTPTVWTAEQYRAYLFKKNQQEYFAEKSALSFPSGDSPRDNAGLVPQIQTGNQALGSVFGSDIVEIRPQGMAEIRFGGKYQHVANPGIPVRNQKTFAFDFGQRIQMNVTGKIGDRLELGINYDTEATFAFDNKMKLEFEGEEDDIVKRLEMGNVNLPLSGTLITGVQSLMGLKGQFQLGNTSFTTVFAEQRSQTKSINVQGGGTTVEFYMRGDEYEANRHYFLSQFFRDHYEEYLEEMPVITSPIQITKVEVWVTNERSSTQNLRNIVAFADLGETEEHAFRNGQANLVGPAIFPGPGSNMHGFPNNSNNTLDPMTLVASIPGVRDIATANQDLSTAGFQEAREYVELANARKLEPSQYEVHRQLGYISLSQALNQDEVLAVAFQFTAAGRTYQVGEFSTDGVTPPQTLVLKLLKSTILDVKMPTWDLMMKNVYSLNAFQLEREDFYLDVLYQNDETGVPIPFLPGSNLGDTLLVGVMELDRLNTNNDPQPDGIFDYVPGVTVKEKNGRIFFPVLEPFGQNLYDKLTTEKDRERFVFQELYDSTRFRAQEQTHLNKYILRGRYKSSSGSEISLNAFNIPRGSVSVTAGGTKLIENQDYTVDYALGKVRIINEGVMNSGAPIRVNFENNTMFNVQTKTFYGTTFEHKFSENFNVGGSFLHLTERSITQKVNIGDEPSSNTIWGLNTNYQDEAPYLTRFADALPFVQTKEKSQVQFQGEFAHLIPGTPRGINIAGESATYLDDFESSQTTIDLRAFTAWSLASTPGGQSTLFPEASLNNDRAYGYNRAKLAWYIIDPSFYTNSASAPDNIRNDPAMRSDNRMRIVFVEEVFPNYQLPTNAARNISMFDLAYYPEERGPYNYDVQGEPGISKGLNADGTLVDPASRWAGIMRPLQINNFEEQNIEFIQFWVLDPFYNNPDAPDGGDLYFNLGSVSEDVLKDGRQSFENGIPATGDKSDMEQTNWGLIPNIQPITEFFSNQAGARAHQDVGLDALTSAEEQSYVVGGYDYVGDVSTAFGPTSGAYQNAAQDASADDFYYYRGDDLDNLQANILERYKGFNGLEGNSSTEVVNGAPASATNMPDKEDANRDQTLSKTESYFQYRVSMRPGDIEVGKNYVSDIYETTTPNLPDGTQRQVRWIQFKIPVFQPEKKVGPISDFRSIRFMRMFMRDFEEPIVLRFARLELVRGEWRRYPFILDGVRENVPIDESDPTVFAVNAVNLEENGSRIPVPYMLPPEIVREQAYTGSMMTQQNEQSMSFEVCGLQDGDARAVFRNFNFDMRMYNKLKMFVHAESGGDIDDLEDGDLELFVRLGSDYNQNYYEYHIPLDVTQWGASVDTDIWPEGNNVEIDFTQLKDLKVERDQALQNDPTLSITNRYIKVLSNGHTYSVVGAPNLGNVRTVMIGVRNPKKIAANDGDDGLEKCAEIWVNELRLADFDQRGGWAATARATAKVADLANVSLSGNMSSIGFGSIDQGVGERDKFASMGYDLQTNLTADKFLPSRLGIKVPMFFSVSEDWKNPQFNPLDPDIEFTDALNNISSAAERDSLRYAAQEYEVRKSFNLTNVRKERNTGGGGAMRPNAPGETIGAKKAQKPNKVRKPKPYDLANFTTSYAYQSSEKRNINLVQDNREFHRFSLNYNYTNRPKNIQPFKQVKHKQLALIRDFNFYYLPSKVSVRTELNRNVSAMRMRNTYDPDITLPLTYNKAFTTKRMYDVAYDLSRGLKIDFNATMQTRIDELPGAPGTQANKDTIVAGLKTMGRPTQYHQTLNINYQIPIGKLPYMSFVTSTVRYTANYDWRTNSTAALNPKAKPELYFGNNIQNSSSIQFSGNANFITFYNQVPFLRKANSGGNAAPKRRRGGAPKRSRGQQAAEEEEKKKKKDEPKALLAVARVAMMLRSVSVTYNETNGTLLPGFILEPAVAGMQPTTLWAPGLDFVLGSQVEIAERASANEWLSKNVNQPNQFQTTLSRNFSARAIVEPWKDIRIEFNASQVSGRNASSIYRYHDPLLDTTFNMGEGFYHFNTMQMGNFTSTFLSIGSAFQPLASGDTLDMYPSEVFEQFLANREVVSERLANSSTITGYVPFMVTASMDTTGKRIGYDGYSYLSQDVLIPAFMSAYSDRDPKEVELNGMPGMPMPNWRVNFNGLMQIPFIKKHFQSFAITHTYKSLYSISSYQTNMLYNQRYDNGNGEPPIDIRNPNGDFLPQIQIGQVSINETFGPFVGINMRMKNKTAFRFDYKRTRQLHLSLINNQLTETRGVELVLGTGYIIKDVTMNIVSDGRRQTITSNLDIKLDYSLRDNQTIIRNIFENQYQVTAGQRVSSLKISADYMLSSKLTARLYYEQTVSDFKTSNAFKTNNINTGIAFRFNLGQ